MTNDIIIRKNVRSLTPNEKQNFVDAVKALKSNTKDNKLGDNRYDDYVLWHAQTMLIPAGSEHPANSNMRNLAHRGPIFLPWHREYLRRFELDLRKEVADVSIPYWDWTFDATLRPANGVPAWKQSPVWQEDYMGGNGDPDNDSVVMDGPFRDWKTQEVDMHGHPSIKDKLRRNFANDIPTLPSQIDLYNAFSLEFYDTPYWDVFSRGFRNALEGWPNGPQLHNRVHVWVGETMELNTSPNDPVFFLNHSNVDRLWALWQDIRFDLGYPGDGMILDRTSQRIEGFNLNDKMSPWRDEKDSKTVGEVLNYRELKYAYDR
jgi:tyrosinase